MPASGESATAHLELREARSEDRVALAALCWQLGYPATAEEVAGRLEALASDEGHAVFVVDLAGEVVGWVHVFLARRLESPPFAELGGLVVSEQHRRQGVGQSLVSRAETWSRQAGAQKLRVRSNAMRSDADAFYRALGFSVDKKQTVFGKSLVSNGESKSVDQG